MNCKRRLQELLAACVFCVSVSAIAAEDGSSTINLKRFRVSLSAATTVGSLEGRPDAAKHNYTERSFDLDAAQPHAKKWMLDFTFRSGDTAEPVRSAANARVGEPVGFAASTPPVGEPRGNELVLRARYDF